MNNLIEFPQKNQKMRRKEQRQNTRQALLSLSMVTLIMGAILLNDSIQRRSQVYVVSDNVQSDDFTRLNRAIASAQPMNPFRDLAWEKNLAQKLAENGAQREIASVSPNVGSDVSQKVGALDQLRFGILHGRYSVQETSTSDGLKISGIEYNETDDVAIQPVEIKPEMILNQFARELPVRFINFDRANHFSQENVQEYRLLGAGNEVLGLVSFAYDGEGKFLSMKVKTSPK